MSVIFVVIVHRHQLNDKQVYEASIFIWNSSLVERYDMTCPEYVGTICISNWQARAHDLSPDTNMHAMEFRGISSIKIRRRSEEIKALQANAKNSHYKIKLLQTNVFTCRLNFHLPRSAACERASLVPCSFFVYFIEMPKHVRKNKTRLFFYSNLSLFFFFWNQKCFFFLLHHVNGNNFF